MSSQVEIANMALDAIGARSTISSLTEGSNESNAIARWWDNAVSSVLRSAHWNFARKQVALTLLQDATNNGIVPTPWLYEYAYPSDCVLIRQFIPMIQVNPVTVVGQVSPVVAYGPPPKFLESTDYDINGNLIQVLLTNQPQAQAVYTMLNTLTAMWDPLFVRCFVAYLAARICMTITGDKGLMNAMFQMAQQYSVEAQAKNGNEGVTILDSIPDWMRARGYNSDWAYPCGGMFSYGPQALTLIN